ncbi:hypothetical protein ABZX92_00390 [Lentzea sp. NPDC006480]|uniref:hypothetical protein n=1 Tax=Lentzea sp. NPDC006480 TaxID=3157176 RepID=UPI0033BC66F0
MTAADDQPSRTGRVRWALLLTMALGCAIAAPLLAMKEDLTALLAIAVVLVCGATAWFATARLRPWSSTSAWATFGVVAIAFVSSVGMKSLWLSTYGEAANGCLVTKRSEHPSRRSPTTYSNELSCGSKQIHYRPSSDYSAKPVGERIDLVIDRTGLGVYAEPGTIKPTTSAVVGVAGLLGAGFVGAVLWWPVKKPKKRPDKPKMQRDFL